MKSRWKQLADFIIDGNEENLRKLNKILSDDKKANYLMAWLANDPSVFRKPVKAWDEVPPKNKGTGSY